MSFTRDDLVSYEAKPQVQDPNHDPFNPAPPVAKEPVATPQASEEAEVDAAIAASVTESTDTGTENDGSTTETQAEPVAADDATPEGENSETGEQSNDGKPGRSRAQERIEELVAERNATKSYAEYLRGIVDDLRKELGTKPKADSQPAVAETTTEEAAPTLEDADYDPVKLARMNAEWIQKQVDARVNSAVKQIETRQSEVAVRQAFESRATEFSKANKDFNIVIANPALPPLAKEASREVILSENGPAIVYHLAKNPDLAARIARMETSSQIKAIGRLEEQLVNVQTKTTNTTTEPSKKPPAKPVSVTKAPPPPKPIQASSSPSKDTNIMGMDEWVANERAAKLKAKQDRLALRKALR